MFATLSRALNSKWLFISLSACTVTAFGARYTIANAHTAPALPGWEWQRHPRAIIYYAKEKVCGCTTSIPRLSEQATASHSELIVVSKSPLPDDVRRSFEGLHITFRIIKDDDLLHQISPRDGAVVVKVRDGLVVGRAYGNTPPEEFYSE